MKSEGWNCCGQSPVHGLLAFGGDYGHVEFIDPRSHRRVADLPIITAAMASGNIDNTISSLRFSELGTGLEFAVGTNSGIVQLFDLRSSKPLFSKDHNYEHPIIDIKFHQENVVSTDKKIMKIWSRTDGKPVTNVEAPNHSDFTDVCHFQNSGLFLMACTQPSVEIVHIPSLGAAPRWCSFLDTITEELEDDPSVRETFDDYRFITRAEIEQLGISSMIGTPYLKAYMHGFFMDLRLYRKIKDVQNPFAYKEYVKEKIKQKREETIKSRIVLPKVPKSRPTQKMAERFLVDLNAYEKSKEKRVNTTTTDSADNRFSSFLDREDFEIDEKSEEFKKTMARQKKSSTKKRTGTTESKEEDQVEDQDQDQEAPPFSKKGEEKKNSRKQTESSDAIRSAFRQKQPSREEKLKRLSQVISERTKTIKREKSAAEKLLRQHQKTLKKPLSTRLEASKLMTHKKDEELNMGTVKRLGGGEVELVYTPYQSKKTSRNQSYPGKNDNKRDGRRPMLL